MRRLLRAMKWLWGTNWPLYAVLVLGSNVAGAAAIMAFIRFLVPAPRLKTLPDEIAHLEAIGLLYVSFAVVVGAAATFFVFRPVLDWQRNPDAHDPNMVRNLVLRLPIYQTAVCAAVWIIGIILGVSLAGTVSGRLAVIVGVGCSLAGAVIVLITYLEAERMVRPAAAAALARRFEDSTLEPPIRSRLRMTWIMTTGAPIVGVLMMIWGHHSGYFTDDAADILPGVTALLLASLVTGTVGTTLSIMSVVDPITELQAAINRVRRGESDTEVDIYDGSEIGVLQAGFNEMMRGLKERQRVRDIFGRYVGTEVARRALEERPTLGGEDRKVAVLFIDVIDSTRFAVTHGPEEVVQELNKFFEKVVETVHHHRGIINKFQGDAALAIFGAPLPLADANSMALHAARDLQRNLAGMELQAGIGIAAGHVVAGHIGGHDRFEYTVIGDAVNQAARLTELAKDTPGRVLTTASTVHGANEAEAARWTLMKSIELRGRQALTQLARPIRETMADRS